MCLLRKEVQQGRQQTEPREKRPPAILCFVVYSFSPPMIICIRMTTSTLYGKMNGLILSFVP